MDIQRSLDRAIRWVQANDYRGYEPADGNASPLHRLTAGRVLPMRILQQIVLRAPVNIRPLIGIAPHESAIGRGYMAWGYAVMYRHRPDEALRREAATCLECLLANPAPASGGGLSWGDPYEYATRAGRRRQGEPLLIWSALIGHAFIDAYEAFAERRFLESARRIGDWIMQLPREDTAAGSCLSYVASRQLSVHNANIVGAAFLARLGTLVHDDEALRLARRAVTYTCSRQRADGAWYYAEAPQYAWIDNFHTGYNLWALGIYREVSKHDLFTDHLVRGLRFYRRRFFDDVGRPWYCHDRTYPIDIQCAAQAIDTLATVADEDGESLALARHVAEWTIGNMQAPDGHFYYRDLGWRKVTTPMLHWGQATMVKALAVLLTRLDKSDR